MFDLRGTHTLGPKSRTKIQVPAMQEQLFYFIRRFLQQRYKSLCTKVPTLRIEKVARWLICQQ
jgi:hypothetical protein